MKNHRAHSAAQSAAPSTPEAGPESTLGKLNTTDRTSPLPAATSGHTPEPLGLKRRHFMGTALALDAAALLAACGGGGGGDSGSNNTSGSSSGSSSGSGSAAPTSWVVSTLAGGGYSWPFRDGTAGTAVIGAPYGIDVDTSGSLFIAEQGYGRIRKITPDGLVSTFAGTGSSGYLDGTGNTAQFNSPTGIAFDTNGTLYVADSYNNLIRKVSPAGVVTTLAGVANTTGSADGMGTSASFNSPTDVAVDQSGHVYVADFNNHLIRKISPAGVVTTLAGMANTTGTADGMGTSASFNSPTSVAVDQSGHVYVADFKNHLIRKISPAGVVTTLAAVANTAVEVNASGTITARFNSQIYLAVDQSDNLYVTDELNHLIRKITPAGLVSTFAGTGSPGWVDGTVTNAKFMNPTGVGVDASGNLYVSDQGNHRIRKIFQI